MKTILFVNACCRKNSRTKALAMHYLDQKKDCSLQIASIYKMNIQPLNEESLKKRDADIQNENYADYKYALQFANADEIVIAAPYWDASFPSQLKIYIENICVNGITFAYGQKGELIKKVKAESLTYITTAGGKVFSDCSVKKQMEELCALFSIPKFRFYCVDTLDMDDQVERKLVEALKEMD